jgi:hypothetical protein
LFLDDGQRGGQRIKKIITPARLCGAGRKPLKRFLNLFNIFFLASLSERNKKQKNFLFLIIKK